jgi:hypothetical protein
MNPPTITHITYEQTTSTEIYKRAMMKLQVLQVK